MKKSFIMLFIITLFSTILFCTQLFVLNVLPNKYLYIILGFIVVLIGLIIFSFVCIKKKTFKIAFIVISLLLFISSILGNIYLFKTNSFIDNILSISYESTDYYLITLKNSNVNNKKELKNQNIGTFIDTIDTNNKEAISKLKSNISFKEKEYIDLLELCDDLLNNNIPAIFINSNYIDLISENYLSFNENIKIVNTVKIIKEIEKTENIDSNFTEKPFNILISGIDTYGVIGKTSRSDVNIVMTVNPLNNEILLTTIPRDFYVQLHGTSGYKDKLTHAGNFGINMSMNTIEDLIGINIDYYIRVNFSTLVSFIDAIGGVSVYSDQTFSEYGYKYTEGINNLNGEQALMFSRIRHVVKGGDRSRGVHQQAVITAIIEKISNSKVLLLNYSAILDSLKNSIQTNIDDSSIKQMIKYQLNIMPKWNVKSISLDGTGSYNYTYSYSRGKLYVMIPNEDTVINANKYINGLIEGKTFQKIENPVEIEVNQSSTQQ